jgi:hypothetical protein
MKSRNLTLTEVLPGRAASRPVSNDLFTSTVDRVVKTYECTWLCDDDKPVGLPNVLAPADGDLDTLFADVATFYPEYSPISAYTHVVSRDFRDACLHASKRTANRSSIGTWVAVAIAEAMTGAYLLGGDEQDVSYALCRRTLAFSLARAGHLYPEFSGNEVAARWALLKELTGLDSPFQLSAVLTFMSSITQPESNARSARLGKLDDLILSMLRAPSPLTEFGEVLKEIYPDVSAHVGALTGPFDERVAAFERIAAAIVSSPQRSESHALAIAFYANQVLPGSLSHTRLVGRRLRDFPSVLIWYAFFASLTRDFDPRGLHFGLGQKLARDIEAPFTAATPPSADISIEELQVLARGGLRGRSIRPVQPRLLLVSLLPGIEIYSRFVADGEERQRNAVARPESSDTIDSLAERDQKVRHLLDQVQALLAPPSHSAQTSPTKKQPRRGRA